MVTIVFLGLWFPMSPYVTESQVTHHEAVKHKSPVPPNTGKTQ